MQLKIFILNIIPNCTGIMSKSAIRLENSKAAITIRNLNAHLSQLPLDFIDNSIIHQIHRGDKVPHRKQKFIERLAFNFSQKLGNF